MSPTLKLLIPFIFISLTWSSVQGQDFEISGDADYTFTNSKLYYHQIHAAAFTGEKRGQNFSCVASSCQAKYFFNGGPEVGYASAPIYLPDGAEVTEFAPTFYDMSDQEFMHCYFVQYALDGSSGPFVKAESFTTAPLVDDDLIINPDETIEGGLIDNSNFGYYILYEASSADASDIRLYGALIEYRLNQIK